VAIGPSKSAAGYGSAFHVVQEDLRNTSAVIVSFHVLGWPPGDERLNDLGSAEQQFIVNSLLL
jgi:hypothetical protein